MLHHSPTCSRLRAMGHCMLPKLLRCMGGHGPVDFIMKVTYASNFHYASFYKGVASCFFAIPGAWAGGGHAERRGNRIPPSLRSTGSVLWPLLRYRDRHGTIAGPRCPISLHNVRPTGG